MTNDVDEFFSAVDAIADERYQGLYERAFAHLGFQLAFPTNSYTDDEAEDHTSVDRSGDLGADALIIDEEAGQILLYQAKSSKGTQRPRFTRSNLGISRSSSQTPEQ